MLREPVDAIAGRSFRGPAIASAAAHLIVLALALFVARQVPEQTPAEVPVSPPRPHLVFLALPGAGAGGGGGGNRSTTPARAAEAPGRDRVTVPTPKPAAAPAQPVDHEPTPQLTVAAMPLAAGTFAMAGVMEPVAASSPDALGVGDGDGADRGEGTGIGPGHGSGLDDGVGGNTGTGVYRAGNDVTAPRLLRSVRPLYTADAMRQRIAGTVALECIVDEMGQVGRCRLQRSLDPRHGLDQEAIKAAAQWRFIPGTRQGAPVPVFVTIELAFSIQ